MKKKIVVIFSSHLTEQQNEKFINHIHSTIGVAHSVYGYSNFNQYSLSEVYNRAIDEHGEENAIMVFCHNDIHFDTKNWGKKLLAKFNHTSYEIIGVAGSTLMPDTGRWWDDRNKMIGIVNHQQLSKKWASEYSDEFMGVRPTIMVDGLFMAVNFDELTNRFDEDFNGFHFYDLGFCFPNYLDGANIGVVTDIRITHQSVGQTNQEWENNRLQFVEKYKADLPIKHVSEDKLKVLLCSQFFKNYTGSEIFTYELARELTKQNCEVTIISSVVGEPMLGKAKKAGIKVFDINNAPNFKNIDGKLTFIKNEIDFDIIHMSHKPIGENILQMYQNTPVIMQVHSEVIPHFEEPIINSNIKKYISIRETITEYIQTFGVEKDKIVEIDNPFDYTRFNTNYKPNQDNRESILFIGTMDHLRKYMLFDLREMTKKAGQELWIIGENSSGYLDQLTDGHVKYLGIQDKPENFIKRCTYTAGIFKGRSTIEGYLCGKKAYIYDVDNQGKIKSKGLFDVPDDIERYRADNVVGKMINEYNKILNI